jgi:hypothetical protein
MYRSLIGLCHEKEKEKKKKTIILYDEPFFKKAIKFEFTSYRNYIGPKLNISNKF